MFEKRGLVLKLEIENEDTRSRANEMQGSDFHHVLIDGSVTINQKQIGNGHSVSGKSDLIIVGAAI